MRFSLLTLVGLVALVAIELFTLKSPTAFKGIVVSYIVFVFLVSCTWGAFCSTQRMQIFCKGCSVLAWACILYGFYLNEDNSVFSTGPSPLAISLAKTILEKDSIAPQNVDPFGAAPSADPFSSPVQSDSVLGLFLRIWQLWIVFNSGILGGILALQIRPQIQTKTASAEVAVSSDKKHSTNALE